MPLFFVASDLVSFGIQYVIKKIFQYYFEITNQASILVYYLNSTLV